MSGGDNGHGLRTRYALLAMVMYGPATAAELVAASHVDEGTVHRNLEAMLEAGVVYIAGRRRRRGSANERGRAARVYAIQPRPYELPDSDELLPEVEA